VASDGELLGGEWNRTWRVSGGFQWPRDADRLPNGNTLVTDSRNHRVLEVTPKGTVVWEVYTPWLPYDAERVRTGDGSNGPTAVEQGGPSAATVSGDDGGDANEDRLERCAAAYRNAPGPGAVEWTPGSTAAGGSASAATQSEEIPRETGRPDPETQKTATRTAAVDATVSPVVALLALTSACAIAIRRRRS
jgi:hypothetical protein